MNKNTLIGFLLIGIIFFAYSYFTKPTPEQIAAQERYRDSIAAVQAQELLEIQLANQQKLQADSINLNLSAAPTDSIREIRMQNNYGEFAHAAEGEETFITLENELLEVILTSKGGRVYSVNLKQFTNKDREPLILFEGEEAAFGATLVTANNRIINTNDFYFQTSQDGNTVTMSLNAGDQGSLDFVYTLEPDDYMLRFEIYSKGLEQILSPSTNSLDIQWRQKARQQETGRSFESRYSYLMYKYTSGDVERLSESRDVSQNVLNKVKWIGYKNQYFSAVLIANESFESTKLESKPFSEGKYIKEYNTTTTIPFNIKATEATLFHYYFGPNDYQLLKRYDRNERFKGQDLQLEKLVPLGWSIFRYVNKWIVIPLFNFWIILCGNIGIAILLLTLAIKTLLFPLSYKSFMSSAKMRVMRPQVEVINEKYSGQENAMTRQQKTMELYRQVGVNPMSGCLPMLLQMPFFIALFQFFPTAIELRHVSFLWAKDLSTYDAIISWNTYIPLITPYFGNHISLFCLLMTITQIFSTKFNMDQTNTGQQQMPGMKTMMYIMPVFMLVFLNQYPAGLNYYYFISTLITVVQMVVFRYFVNEEKLLAQLEANKKNPQKKKKSGFMSRLEEAQRQQQALAKQRAAQQRKTGKR